MMRGAAAEGEKVCVCVRVYQGVVGAAVRKARAAVSSLTRALAELMLEVIGDYHI